MFYLFSYSPEAATGQHVNITVTELEICTRLAVGYGQLYRKESVHSHSKLTKASFDVYLGDIRTSRDSKRAL